MRTILFAVTLLIGFQAQANCPNAFVDLSGNATDIQVQACAAIERATPMFKACGLRFTRSVTVEVIDRMPPGFEEFIGVYHVTNENIAVLSPRALFESPIAMRQYPGLSAKALFDAVLTHELAHAAVHQMHAGADISLSGREYIAGAMQVAAMPEAGRTLFLASQNLPETVSPGYFNTFILQVRPEKFAALAYGHFAAPSTGCGFVARILSGAVVLGER